MARYHYTRENENGVVLYLESEPAEDAMDEFDDEIAVGFSGNGYLSFWTRCRKAAEALPSATVSHRVTAWSLRGVAMQPKDTEERRRAIDRVNRAYADEDYDRYERLIERYCHRFGFDGDYSLFEDACTDARIFGHGIG